MAEFSEEQIPQKPTPEQIQARIDELLGVLSEYNVRLADFESRKGEFSPELKAEFDAVEREWTEIQLESERSLDKHAALANLIIFVDKVEKPIERLKAELGNAQERCIEFYHKSAISFFKLS